MRLLGFSLHTNVHATHQSASITTQAGVVSLCIALATAVAVLWVLRAQRSEPPPLSDANAWQWVSTAPGINVYMHERSRQSATKHVTAWIAFRYSSSPVSVNADVIELRDFDCDRLLSRRVMGAFRGSASGEVARSLQPARGSPWRHDSPQTVLGEILARVCATAD